MQQMVFTMHLRDYHILHILTAWCIVLLEKLTGLQLVKKFPTFHGTRRFITALTSVRHLSLSWASRIQSIHPHPTSWRSILILSTHLRLGLPSSLFPFGFPTKTLYTPLSSPIRATCPAHFILDAQNILKCHQIHLIFMYVTLFHGGHHRKDGHTRGRNMLPKCPCLSFNTLFCIGFKSYQSEISISLSCTAEGPSSGM